MGPLVTILARAKCRSALREKGYSFRQINDVIHAVDDEAISWACVETSISPSAIGDGKIIDAILDFFKSPEGQALLAALIKMLLALIGGL